MPGWELVIAGDKRRPFYKTRAVNAAVEKLATGILVLNDADSVCPFAQVRAAAEMAAADHGLVFAFTRYVRLDEHGKRTDQEFGGDSHGCIAIRRSDFLELGGYDESFVGWGPEDQDFNLRAGLRWPIRRVPGDIEHIWHGERRPDDSPTDSDEREVGANWARWRTR